MVSSSSTRTYLFLLFFFYISFRTSIMDDTTENKATIYDDKKIDPFKLIDTEGAFVASNDIEFSQPPATKWELWSYYLYYNGVLLIYIK